MKKLTKNSAIFIVFLPQKRLPHVEDLTKHLEEICDDDVYPILTLSNSDEWKFDFLNCQNMTDEQMDELKKSVNEFSELLKSKQVNE